jgi:hypothetical protein
LATTILIVSVLLSIWVVVPLSWDITRRLIRIRIAILSSLASLWTLRVKWLGFEGYKDSINFIVISMWISGKKYPKYYKTSKKEPDCSYFFAKLFSKLLFLFLRHVIELVSIGRILVLT